MTKLVDQELNVQLLAEDNSGLVYTAPPPPSTAPTEFLEVHFNEASNVRNVTNFNGVGFTGVYEDLNNPAIAGNHDQVEGLIPPEGVPACNDSIHHKLAQRVYGQTRIHITTPEILNITNPSVGWWFRAESVGTEQVLLFLEDKWKLILTAGGDLHLTVWLEDSSTVTCQAPLLFASLTHNVWFTFSNTDKRARLYIDGALVATSDAGTDSIATPSGDHTLYIGGAPGEGHFIGVMDHLLIQQTGSNVLLDPYIIDRYSKMMVKPFPYLEEFDTLLVNDVPPPLRGLSKHPLAAWNVVDVGGVRGLWMGAGSATNIGFPSYRRSIYTEYPQAIADAFMECSVTLDALDPRVYTAGGGGQEQFQEGGISHGVGMNSGSSGHPGGRWIRVDGGGFVTWGSDSAQYGSIDLPYDPHLQATRLGIRVEHGHPTPASQSSKAYFYLNEVEIDESPTFSSYGVAFPRLYTTGWMHAFTNEDLSPYWYHSNRATFDWFWIDAFGDPPVFDTGPGWGAGHRMSGPWSIGRRT